MQGNNVGYEYTEECNLDACPRDEIVPQRSVLGAYRPWGSLARALYEKQQHDGYLKNFDKMQVSLMHLWALQSATGKLQANLTYNYKIRKLC